jgi:hypothetical protein
LYIQEYLLDAARRAFHRLGWAYFVHNRLMGRSSSLVGIRICPKGRKHFQSLGMPASKKIETLH